MPQMRVFLSSTAYDLGMVRGQLGAFITGLGHQVVMSEYSGVLYDPKVHTHKACIQELATCDAVVMIIGSRWGSVAKPEFIDEIAAEGQLDDATGALTDALEKGNVSVTQLEALTAFNRGIPMFVFVERSVRAEARFFEVNQELANSGELRLPTMGDPRAAKYIFDFLRYVEARTSGNAVTEFDSIEGIQRHLKNQWSAWLQRLLNEVREAQTQQSVVDAIGEKLEDLRVAMVSTMPDADARRVASAVLEFRILCDVVLALDDSGRFLFSDNPPDFGTLLSELGVHSVDPFEMPHRGPGARSIVVFRDKVIELRIPPVRFARLSVDWEAFRSMSVAERRVVVETLRNDRRSIGAMSRVRAIDAEQRERLFAGGALRQDEFERFMERSDEVNGRMTPRT